ncbi:MAG: hypothetical protein H7A25_09430 [Leptospiraceae bacterium]|nr:hypothetical protein [Leptospiraceae bacterium]MCP5500111.1 hypothetical protein [Leptospiraceae bacterium]
MKSSQINFYMTDEDILEIDNYLKAQGLVIISAYHSEKEIKVLPSLLVSENDKPIQKNRLILLQEDLPHLKPGYIETKEMYNVDIMDSPVIEFSPGGIKENKFYRGRLYYVKDILNKKGQSEEKNAEFLKIASSLFRWIKKHFKNAKLQGFEDFLVTERTANCLDKNRVELVLNHVMKG